MPSAEADCSPSNHRRLQDGKISTDIDLALQAKTTRLQQLFKFFPSPLSAGDRSHHVNVEDLDEVGFRIVANVGYTAGERSATRPIGDGLGRARLQSCRTRLKKARL